MEVSCIRSFVVVDLGIIRSSAGLGFYAEAVPAQSTRWCLTVLVGATLGTATVNASSVDTSTAVQASLSFARAIAARFALSAALMRQAVTPRRRGATIAITEAVRARYVLARVVYILRVWEAHIVISSSASQLAASRGPAEAATAVRASGSH